jgi:hypothetical protein
MNSSIFAILKAAMLAVLFSAAAVAQTGTGTLRGVVSDPSGAVVPQTTVIATSATGQTYTGVSSKSGVYEIKDLPAGHYTLDASSAGFSLGTVPELDVTAGQVTTKDVKFDIAVQQEKVNVEESGNQVDVSPSNNVGAVVLKGKDLDALSDDPDELQSDLAALAGPAAGPNGGQIYIDGFSGGQLPPKSAIREIRINSNPFSAQFDRIGFGRIEVFTKPGSDKFHGQVQLNDNHSFFNADNPFAKVIPDYHTDMVSGNVSGPISKKASFFLNVQQRNIQDASIINAVILDPTLTATPFNDAVLKPNTRTSVTPRVDVQLTDNNTLSMRYEFNRSAQSGLGIGGFDLSSLSYNTNSIQHEIQLSDTQTINPTTINETRFQFERNRNTTAADTLAPLVNVIGAFTNGGNSIGIAAVDTDAYEFQNYTSMNRGKHFIKFGARVRATQLSNTSTGGFNGTFTFDSLAAYQVTQQGIANGLTPAQIRAAGGGASQFSITQGQPLTENTYADAGLYVEDDWRIRPNLTASYGLRYETQNGIGDHLDFAPRLGISWGLGSSKTTPKTVIRAGWGIFYDRFSQNSILQAERLNGVNQQQFVVNSPDFYPNIPTAAALAGAITSPTIYQISPNIRAPYNMQGAVTVERQLSKMATLSVSYINSRGMHNFDIRNINAPLPGTYTGPGTGVRPLGNADNVYMYESEGIFKQNQLIANSTIRMGQRLSLATYYSLSFANADTSGSFPTNSYDLKADYGRASFDVRNRFFIGGSVSAPWGVRLSPFITASSGVPFNFTTGQDLNGDSIFNDRPYFATGTGPGIVVSRFGTFSAVQQPGAAIVPINYGNGPAQFTINMRVSKTIGLGPKIESAGGRRNGGGGGGGGDHGGGPRGGGGAGAAIARGGGGGGPMGGIFNNATTPHKYNLTLSANARNLFNRENLAAPIGNLSSPLFGTSNALAGGGFGPGGSSASNRRIDLQVQFNF